MIISKHNFDVRPFAAAALTLLLASFCYSQPKDVAGWETARWGMSNQDLVCLREPGLTKFIVMSIPLPEDTVGQCFSV